MSGQPPRIADLSADISVIEQSTAIIDQVSCANDWDEVVAILKQHGPFYLGLNGYVRSSLNDRIKEIMSKRLDSWQQLGDVAARVVQKLEEGGK
jgi:hypothetical protein